MRTNVRSTRIAGIRLIDVVPWLPALILLPFLVGFLIVSLSRIGSAFGLEWNEGHSLEQALRFAQGEPLYPAPDAGWIPYMYAPFYHWIWGCLIWATGSEGLWIGRSISWLATLATATAVGFGTWRATSSPPAVAAGVCLFFAFFAPSGFWFDLARVDMLATALMLWGVVLLPAKGWGIAATWVLLGLAVLAKQSMAPVALLGWGWICWQDPRRGRVLAVATLLAAASLLLTMSRTGSGWFWFWVFEAPRHHASDWSTVLRGRLWAELLAPMAVPLALVGWRLCLARAHPLKREEVLALGAFGLAVAAGVAAMAKFGGFRNNLVPAFALLALLTGMAIARLCRESEGYRVPVVVALLLTLQVWQPWGGVRWRYAIRDQVPPAEAGAAMAGLEQWLRERHDAGERVLVLHHQWIGARNGHHTSYNLDMVRVAEWAGVAVPPQAREPIAMGEFDWIILDRELEEEWLPTRVAGLIAARYQLAGRVDSLVGVPSHQLLPVTGAAMGPRYVWVRED